MCNKLFFKPILFALSVLLFVSCDKDYNEIGYSIVGENPLGITNNTAFTVQTSWAKTGALGTNNLEINALGVLDNSAFGQTTARFATQVQLATPNPAIDVNLLQSVQSVTLYIPYFTNAEVNYDSNARPIYTLDSIYGTKTAKLKLRIYENKYQISSKNSEVGAPLLDSYYPQFYYTDQKSVFDSNKGQLLYSKDDFVFSEKEFEDQVAATTTTAATTTYTAPGMRVDLDNNFFEKLLFDKTSTNYDLSANANFEEYFKGLYFDVEKAESNGVMAMMNFKKGTIVVKYKEKTSSTDATLVDKSITLNLTGNTVNLLSNDFSASGTNYNSSPIADRIYVRGGEGSVGQIELFNATDVVSYNRTTNTIDSSKGNGIPDELDYLKAKGWLINEANLTFYVDQTAMSGVTEPSRIFLYDVNNKRSLIDYDYDVTLGNTANYNKQNFGGIIEKDASGRGLKYKFRITNYIRNLVDKDSTNVKLGLSVAQAISNTYFTKTKNSPAYSVWKGLSATQKNSYFYPVSSVMNPLGTILYGSGINVPDDKRLKLEIHYTKPN